MSDLSVDPNPQKDPNYFLAPHAGQGIFLVIIYLLIAFFIYKNYKTF